MTDANEIDYGPLAGLIGSWRGDEGLDVSPEPEGSEESPYYETCVFEAAGDVQNAESQRLAVVRYHLVATRKSDDKIFHDQVGHWTWDRESGTVAHSLSIPRAVCVLAGGSHSGAPEPDGSMRLVVSARSGDADWGIIQSPFMSKSARTVSFEQELVIQKDLLTYTQTTSLEIYGRSFEHVDRNRLERCP